MSLSQSEYLKLSAYTIIWLKFWSFPKKPRTKICSFSMGQGFYRFLGLFTVIACGSGFLTLKTGLRALIFSHLQAWRLSFQLLTLQSTLSFGLEVFSSLWICCSKWKKWKNSGNFTLVVWCIELFESGQLTCLRFWSFGKLLLTLEVAPYGGPFTTLAVLVTMEEYSGICFLLTTSGITGLAVWTTVLAG